MSAREERKPHAAYRSFLGGKSGDALPTLREVRSPNLLRTFARTLVVLFGLAPIALWLVPWQQTAVGQGRVVAYSPVDRQQNIEATVQGRVTRWYVREGSKVRKGDPIVEISDIDPKILERLREEKIALQARLHAQRQRARAISARAARLRVGRKNALEAAAARVRVAEQAYRAAERAEEAAEAAAKTAELNYERQKALIQKGLTSTRQLELAELDRTRTTTGLDRARAAKSGAKSNEAALASERERISFDTNAVIEDARASEAQALADAASTQAELTRLEVRLARQTAQSVVAPRDGTLLRFFVAQEGELVKPGDPLAVLVPDTDARTVELWLDGNDVPLISVGRKVRLQFEGWPALQFSGWPSVAVGTFGGIVALVDSTDDGKGRFRTLVVPDPADDPWPETRYLRQGVRANGWVLLDRVSLGFELWRRFNGFPPTVASPGEGLESRGEKASQSGAAANGGKGKAKGKSKDKSNDGK